MTYSAVHNLSRQVVEKRVAPSGAPHFESRKNGATVERLQPAAGEGGHS
jgi:hypothetical protein